MRPILSDPSFKRFLKAAPVAVILAASAGVADAKRLALVVGNSEYDAVYSLKNAARDASDVASRLRSLGFEVTLLTDTGDADFRRELDAFATRAEADDVESTLFYFSGHAFQLDGVNYLVPKDAVLSSADAIKTETWRLDEIVKRLEDRDRSTLIFLDACRNNPLPEGARGNSASGLAKLETGSGTFVAFATQPNNVTADGAGDNSPFTEALLEHLGTEGISISDLMIRVRNAVEDKTIGRQTPWDQSSLRAQFYFNPQNETATLSQADYEMLAALDPETRNRLLSLMGAERIDFDEDRVDDMEVAIKVASLTDDMPMARSGGGEEDGGFVVTGIGDDQLEQIVRRQVESDEEDPFDITDVFQITSVPVDPAPGAVEQGTVAATSPTALAAAPATDGVVVGSAATGSVVIGSASGQVIAGSAGSGTVVTGTSDGAVIAGTSAATGAVGTVAASAATAQATTTITGSEVAALPDSPSDVPQLAANPQLLPGLSRPTRVQTEVDPLVLASLSPSRAVQVAGTPSTVLAAQEPDERDLEIVGVREATWPRLEGRELARAVQTELSRLGCYRMAVDGAFGRGSKLSLVRYYGNKGIAAQTLEPTNALLQVLRAEPKVVCANTTEIQNRQVAAISTRVSAVREKVAPKQKQEAIRNVGFGGTSTVTTSSGEEKAVSGIRPGGFR